MDAKTKVWSKSQLHGCEHGDTKSSSSISREKSIDANNGDGDNGWIVTEPAMTLDEVGYVFDLAVLPDSKPGLRHYALAAA
eukprot:239011-Ditylum_brightwellii.AAC.1